MHIGRAKQVFVDRIVRSFFRPINDEDEQGELSF
jgi:hypothetical protein